MSEHPRIPFRVARLAIYGTMFTFNGFSIIAWLVMLSAASKILTAPVFAIAGIVFAYHATMMMFFPGYKRILTSQEVNR